MFGRKLKTQKENVISAQEETLDMHPVIHVADSIIEYQKQLAEREVESLDEMADIQKAFVLATKENERLKDQVQELSSVFADVGQIATSFDGVKNEIVDSVGEAQQKIDKFEDFKKCSDYMRRIEIPGEVMQINATNFEYQSNEEVLAKIDAFMTK